MRARRAGMEPNVFRRLDEDDEDDVIDTAEQEAIVRRLELEHARSMQSWRHAFLLVGILISSLFIVSAVCLYNDPYLLLHHRFGRLFFSPPMLAFFDVLCSLLILSSSLYFFLVSSRHSKPEQTHRHRTIYCTFLSLSCMFAASWLVAMLSLSSHFRPQEILFHSWLPLSPTVWVSLCVYVDLAIKTNYVGVSKLRSLMYDFRTA